MRAADRDERMDRFRRGEVQVLVGTTVIEVGVDVPEATVMMVLDADRFGLAQLHQLRGRVGRGEAQSFCVLVSDRYPRAGSRADDEQAAVKARLDALEASNDGFALAELDMEQRREGELLGLNQSGLPPLRVASLSRKEHRQLSVRGTKGGRAAGRRLGSAATRARRSAARDDGRLASSSRGGRRPGGGCRCLSPVALSRELPKACDWKERHKARGRCRIGSSRRFLRRSRQRALWAGRSWISSLAQALRASKRSAGEQIARPSSS